ncbi:hypothetical protein VNO78_05803 [Psophocarpus tetragonolobus]|uniref:Uncharacterized protein n=1 Tax=Psophocarpus tetragonolobus TaxID=3891 RepID=A0AAN9SSW5_PSOTE
MHTGAETYLGNLVELLRGDDETADLRRSDSAFCSKVIFCKINTVDMGISKTEVNLRRLLAAAPQQQNQAKLVHYVATLREQLEQLAEERTSEGLPRISKAMLNDYSDKIEAIASKLVYQVAVFARLIHWTDLPQLLKIKHMSLLRLITLHQLNWTLRHMHTLQNTESSLMMSQFLQNTEKILDCTEKAIEHSLASTGRASNSNLLKEFQNFLLNLACDVSDDMCICHGYSCNPNPCQCTLRFTC